jgi:hypothetical protein
VADDLCFTIINVEVPALGQLGLGAEPGVIFSGAARAEFRIAAGLAGVAERGRAADVPAVLGDGPLDAPDPVPHLILLQLRSGRPHPA